MWINSAANTACSKPNRRHKVSFASAFHRRFRVFTLLLPALAAAHAQTVLPPCKGGKADTYVHIDHVIDGDTVVLANKERVRLIGIDTPEIGYRGRPSQAGADSARDFLEGLLNKQESYALIYGIEREDAHGRTLAHIFLPDHTNLQALILARGYATPLNIPPDVAFSDCYRQQAGKAIQAKIGLWRLAQYQPVAASALTGRERGYRIIYGRVTHAGRSATSIWLDMNPYLAIRISPDELEYFPGLVADDLPGQTIQVRGRLYPYKKHLQLRLRHHNDLQILSHLPGHENPPKQAMPGH